MKEKSIKIIKFLIAVTVIFSVFFVFENKITYGTDLSISGILDRGNSFISQGNASSGTTQDSIANDFLPIGRVLVAIATVTVFIVTAITGVRWITASPEQQAALKKQLIGLVVSIVVIYGAVGIWTLVKTIMEGITG